MDPSGYFVVKPALVGQGARFGANVIMVEGLPNAAGAAWTLTNAVSGTLGPVPMKYLRSKCCRCTCSLYALRAALSDKYNPSSLIRSHIPDSRIYAFIIYVRVNIHNK